MQKLYGEHAADILKAYSDTDIKKVATELASDRFIAFNTWKFVDLHSRSGNPVYRYYFTRIRPSFNHKEQAGASHSSEIEYALGNLATNKSYDWSADDKKVSETLQNYFANFIKTGNPNAKGLTQWDKYSPSKPYLITIDINCTPKISDTEPRYHLLDSLTMLH